jgi:hypothetical protein
VGKHICAWQGAMEQDLFAGLDVPEVIRIQQIDTYHQYKKQDQEHHPWYIKKLEGGHRYINDSHH